MIFFFFHIGDFFAQVSNTFFTTDGPGWINPFGKRKNCRASLGKDWKQKHLCFLLILHSDPDMRSYGARYIFNRHSSNSSLQIHCFWPPSWRRSKTCERAANLIWRSHQFVSFWFLRDRRFYKRLRQIRPWASEGCLSPICSKSNLEWKSSQDFCTLLLPPRPLSFPQAAKCDILTRIDHQQSRPSPHPHPRACPRPRPIPRLWMHCKNHHDNDGGKIFSNYYGGRWAFYALPTVSSSFLSSSVVSS